MNSEDLWKQRMEERLRALEQHQQEHTPSFSESLACTVLQGFVIGLAISLGVMLLALLPVALFLLLWLLDMLGFTWPGRLMQAIQGWLAG